ncbi:MAG: hypothetical protein DMF69_17185 [Acidobacteria bacterium]|nr:MAG: hypothetical protein DMF69_17185 [Acidobacteriota bacterium]
MSEPRKHHYVPQFYQRGFRIDSSNRIWVYQKEQDARRCGVKRTGMTIDLYAFRNKDGQIDFGSVERHLATIDNQGATIIQKLERGKSLTDKERIRLSRFVSIMWRRTPKHKARVKQTTRELLPKALAPFYEMADGLTSEARVEVERIRKEYTKNPPDFLFAHSVLRDSAFEDRMSKMDWAFFKAPPGKEFVTCDDPARFSTGSGLDHKDATIAFPLSRTLLLQCKWNSGWGNRFQVLSDEQVDYFNLWTVKGADEQVYASSRSEEIQFLVDKHIGTVK